MRKPIAVLTVFVALLCSTPTHAGFCDNSDDGPSWKKYVDDMGGGSGGSGAGGLRSFRTTSTSSSFGDFRAFFVNTSVSTCGIGFEIPVIPVLVIITTNEGLGALIDGLLERLGGGNSDGPTWDGNTMCPPGGGTPGGGTPGGGTPGGGTPGGGTPGGGGVAAVPEPATLAVWGLLGLVSTGAGYRRLRRKSA